MPTLIIDYSKKIIKYLGYFLLALVGLYIITIVLRCIFNLGAYLGTFMRHIYSLACQ